MARVLITPAVAPGQYPTAGVTMTPAAADATNFNYFVSTGNELLIALNTDSGAQTVTIHSQADAFKRTGDITAESIAAGAYHIFGPFAKTGWADSTGNINVDASDALVELAVIRLA